MTVNNEFLQATEIGMGFHKGDALLQLGDHGQPLRLAGAGIQKAANGLLAHDLHLLDFLLCLLGEGNVLPHQNAGVAGQVVGVVADTLHIASDGEEAADGGGWA